MSFTVKYEFKPLAEICHRQARWQAFSAGKHRRKLTRITCDSDSGLEKCIAPDHLWGATSRSALQIRNGQLAAQSVSPKWRPIKRVMRSCSACRSVPGGSEHTGSSLSSASSFAPAGLHTDSAEK